MSVEIDGLELTDLPSTRSSERTDALRCLLSRATLAGTVVRLATLILLGAAVLHAAPQATVDADELPVNSSSSGKGVVVGSLKRGDTVTVGFTVSGSDGDLCKITYAGPPRLSGFVPCERLNQETLPERPRYSSLPSNRAVARAAPDSVIAEALRLSGIGQAVAQLGDPSLYLAALPNKNLTPQQVAEIKTLIMQSMRPDRFERTITASLKSGFPADAYPQLLDLLRSPLAREMSTVELQQSRAGRKEIEAFAAGLNQTPPDARRLAIIKRIDQVTGSSQLMVDIVVAVLEGMEAASGQISTDQIRQMINEVRNQRADSLRQAGLVHLLYEYRTVPDDQLDEYANMLASPVAIRFNEAAGNGLLVATRQASGELMRAMMQRFRPTRRP